MTATYLHDKLDRIELIGRYYSGADERRETTESEIESEAISRIVRGHPIDSPEWYRRLQAGDLWRLSHRWRALARDEPAEMGAFLDVRHEPADIRAEIAETCTQLAGHLDATAAQCLALHGDDEHRGRWPWELPRRAAETARERAGVWRALAAVAEPPVGPDAQQDGGDPDAPAGPHPAPRGTEGDS